MASILPQKKKAKDQKAQLLWWKSQIGKRLLSDITSALISEYKDKLLSENTNRGKKRTPATTNRYLAVLSHTFTIACKEWGWLSDNPLRFVSKSKEPRGRVRFLDEEESQNSYLYTIVILAISNGMRLGEIMNLSWPNIDFVHKLIILEETKNGERRQIPLTGKALELLKDLKQKHLKCTNLIFPSKNL